MDDGVSLAGFESVEPSELEHLGRKCSIACNNCAAVKCSVKTLHSGAKEPDGGD